MKNKINLTLYLLIICLIANAQTTVITKYLSKSTSGRSYEYTVSINNKKASIKIAEINATIESSTIFFSPNFHTTIVNENTEFEYLEIISNKSLVTIPLNGVKNPEYLIP